MTSWLKGYWTKWQFDKSTKWSVDNMTRRQIYKFKVKLNIKWPNGSNCHLWQVDLLANLLLGGWPFLLVSFLFVILQTSENHSNVALVRGAIFFIGMSLWGAQRVKTLSNYSATTILPTFVNALGCKHHLVYLFYYHETILLWKELAYAKGPNRAGHELLTFISTLTNYACFEKRALFHNILQRSMERNISFTFYDALQKEQFYDILLLWCDRGVLTIKRDLTNSSRSIKLYHSLN